MLCDIESVVHLDAEVPDCAFDLRVVEKQLHSSEIARLPIGENQTDRTDGFADDYRRPANPAGLFRMVFSTSLTPMRCWLSPDSRRAIIDFVEDRYVGNPG